MKLAMFSEGEDPPCAGVVIDNRIIHIQRADSSLPSTVLEIVQLGPDLLTRIQEAVLEKSGHPISEVELKAPISRPGKMLAIGANYHSHIDEIRKFPSLSHLAEIKHQVWFNKQTSAVTGPYDEIRLPAQSRMVDYEVELAIVIGKRCQRVSQENALDYIAGYTIANDLSPRDLSKEAEACLAKSFDGFAPTGPWIVTVDELPDPQNLHIKSFLNGELKQSESTSDMVCGCAELISYLSTYITLEPGDILMTGTPAGIGALSEPPRLLQHGDTVRCEIEGIGAIESVFRRQ